MPSFYKVAGLTLQMDAFGRTAAQAEPYRIAACEKPDIVIRSNRQTLQERAPHLSEDDCEYMSTGSSFYRQLLQFDGMLLHASAVMMDGRAYLFSAPSGTGKSTHTRLWQQTFGKDRAQILNDDKPALRLEDGVWYAYGTPWSGKHDISINIRVPVAGIAMIERSGTNRIEPFGGREAVFAILEQTVRPRDAAARIKLLELMDQLLTQVPVWKLHCNMDPEAAVIAYTAMKQSEK